MQRKIKVFIKNTERNILRQYQEYQNSEYGFS